MIIEKLPKTVTEILKKKFVTLDSRVFIEKGLIMDAYSMIAENLPKI
jgi:hypothetical protein